MNVTAEVPALLALDAGIRETGWAVFKNGEVIESGVTGLSTRRHLDQVSGVIGELFHDQH